MPVSYPTLPNEVIEAITRGYHGDPFSVLGPHAYGEGMVIRAYIPYAKSAEIIIGKKSYPMESVHPEQFFECYLTNKQYKDNYQIKVIDWGDNERQYRDPYSFSDILTDFDEYLLAEGTHEQMYERLGAHIIELNGVSGVHFAVWAPNAQRVSIVGNFNSWDGRRYPMRFRHNSGIWNIFIPGLEQGTVYKYEIKTRYPETILLKTDPVGYFNEVRPNTASIVWDINRYQWQDQEWLDNRAKHNDLDAPINVYEVHLGSWKRSGAGIKDDWITYTDLAKDLVSYVKNMGYTHIELLPITEHPYDGSWGYQVTGYFAPTSRFGNPNEFMALVDACHQAGIGVILDWVPAHFPRDAHGLAFFDGTHLYEHADPRQGTHPDWGTLIFNYGRPEVSQFLISSALFWIEKYHIDGLRVDAVASMLYLDFSKEQGQWVPNRYGGRENLEAIAFIRDFNRRVHATHPGVLTIAEESTSWPYVTRPSDEGGLGFDLKWNMGWMHDTLNYMENDPVYRAYHHGSMTFSLLYAFSEHFMLPFSHDEVVHLKKSLLDKMPGDRWQKFANLRTLLSYQTAHPGKKLLFMGCEFGQWREWSEDRSLDWHLLEQFPDHQGLHRYVMALNNFYLNQPAFYEDDNSWEGFDWLDLNDWQRSILSFARHSRPNPETGQKESVLVACNFTPIVRQNYRLGVPKDGTYIELLNSDAAEFGGSNLVNSEPLVSSPTPWHNQPHSIEFTLPPLAVVYLKAA
ncbi:MAG: 1,4-alpha-glucan branching protein GlgB [Candidatus Promineifilaceae bacterium]